ncbi:hypothetical protein NKH77_28990 [Streptomyces sp. M19]
MGRLRVRGGGRGRLRDRADGGGQELTRRRSPTCSRPTRSCGICRRTPDRAGHPVRGRPARTGGAGRREPAGPHGVGAQRRRLAALRRPGSAHVPSLTDSDPDAGYGDWVPFAPMTKDQGPFPDREWTTVDGITFRDSDVWTRPLVTANHEFYGRESMRDSDGGRVRERRMRLYRDMRRLAHAVRLGGTHYEVGSEEILRTPRPTRSTPTVFPAGCCWSTRTAGRCG